MSAMDKRRTRIDFNQLKLLRETETPQLRPKPRGLKSSLQTIPKTDVTNNGSSWNTYEKEGWERDLGDLFPIASQRNHPFDLVHVKEFPQQNADRMLDMLNQIWHQNFVTVLEVFKGKKPFLVVLEYMAISLHQVVRCFEYPSELQLAAILGQVNFQRMIHWRCGLTAVDTSWVVIS
jgi:hypothetical protein